MVDTGYFAGQNSGMTFFHIVMPETFGYPASVDTGYFAGQNSGMTRECERGGGYRIRLCLSGMTVKVKRRDLRGSLDALSGKV